MNIHTVVGCLWVSACYTPKEQGSFTEGLVAPEEEELLPCVWGVNVDESTCLQLYLTVPVRNRSVKILGVRSLCKRFSCFWDRRMQMNRSVGCLWAGKGKFSKLGHSVGMDRTVRGSSAFSWIPGPLGPEASLSALVSLPAIL